jgi:Lrp/AsnC family transcriptional regulator
MQSLDVADRRLMRILQEEGDLPVAELGARAGLSAAACWRRLDRLERAGVILGRRVEVDARALGYAVTVFLRITLDKTRAGAFDAFLSAVRDLPEVVRVETLLGRVDVRMDVLARDLDHYCEIYREKILALPHVAEIEALLLVAEIKNTERVPI